jgi:iron complex transport system ATP-binding protein
MLKLHEISTGFVKNRKTHVLHENINIALAPGTVTLLLGANGIGKSVFLKTLLNIFKPISGSIEFENQKINELKSNELASIISLMLPNPPAIELMSALEIVMSGQQRFNNPWKIQQNKALDNVKLYFDKCKVSHLINKNFAELSDGEKQKVMLVRCLAQETPIILLDEPMAFLDYPSRKQFLQLIKEIAEKEGKYIIVSTHDIEISLPICNTIIALTKNNWQYFTQPNLFKPELIFSENP